VECWKDGIFGVEGTLRSSYDRSGVCFGGFRPAEASGGATGFSPWGSTKDIFFATHYSGIPSLHFSGIHLKGEKSWLSGKDSKTRAFCRTHRKIRCHFFLVFALTFSIYGDNRMRQLYKALILL
jgi:hypothetical protein